ncbi:nitroreductase family protein [Lipingzhangella sp. LS1_29]|uniref:Nitroreductase family protein n=1 Tax=Lipingzhangella rawalii TaxID=2055835 RepID=A0ABU2H2U2_9ACTN|nr:nitroreductase family protein [Lipingzhangella rawalii]MDS1269622.1 nitroreductase family protein [Lipingzhangella rawalii]
MRIDELDLASVDHVLTTTRAARRRLDLDRPVPLTVIRECLEIALQAPNGFNFQLWRWLVVTEPDTRAAIAEIYRRMALPAVGALASQVPADDVGTRKVADSSRYLGEHLDQVPVLVIPCHVGGLAENRALFAELGYDSDLDNMAASATYGEIWPAAWSLMLALRARGLGSSLTMIHLGAEPEVARLLAIPDGVSQAGLIPVAYFRGEDFAPGPRRPLAEVAFQDRWNTPL